MIGERRRAEGAESGCVKRSVKGRGKESRGCECGRRGNEGRKGRSLKVSGVVRIRPLPEQAA